MAYYQQNNDEYVVSIAFTSSKPIDMVRKGVSNHFDANAVAGQWSIQYGGSDHYHLEVTRFFDQDMEYIYPRINGEISADKIIHALKEQYFDELDQFDPPHGFTEEIEKIKHHLMQNAKDVNVHYSSDDYVINRFSEYQAFLQDAIKHFVMQSSEWVNQLSNEYIHEGILIGDEAESSRIDADRAGIMSTCRNSDLEVNPHCKQVMDAARDVLQSASREGLESGLIGLNMEAVSTLSTAIKQYKSHQENEEDLAIESSMCLG